MLIVIHSWNSWLSGQKPDIRYKFPQEIQQIEQIRSKCFQRWPASLLGRVMLLRGVPLLAWRQPQMKGSLRRQVTTTTQKSCFDLECAARKTLTRRDRFLAEIDSATPSGKLHKLIEPHYPKPVGAVRPPIGLARMLRMYVGPAVLRFVGRKHRRRGLRHPGNLCFRRYRFGPRICAGCDNAFEVRHLLEAKDLTRRIFDTSNAHPAEEGLMMREPKNWWWNVVLL